MRTIKLVVIGASGVGKTSIRGQYISGQFSTGYRATIGADFISKSVPHPWNPDESVMLQIWDTAGQERFSTLSSAFFRGADAVLLMFDVNKPETMSALSKWWDEFRVHAPLDDDAVDEYCSLVVGNKVDMPVEEGRIDEMDARIFLHGLFPNSAPMPIPLTPPSPQLRSDSIPISSSVQHTFRTRTLSQPHSSPTKSKARSRSSSSRPFGGTMTTTHTTLTIYHTPSSSVFDYDAFASARASPEPSSTTPSRSTSPSFSWGTDGLKSPRRMRSTSEMTELSDVPTITPHNFLSSVERRRVVDRGPRLFFTSAKTGVGVPDVFEYAVRRVVGRWEEMERRMSMREGGDTGSTILSSVRLDDRKRGRKAGCCAS